jgi:hypothetical protein
VLAVNVNVPGAHMLAGLVSTIDAVGNGLTVTVTEDVVGLLHASVTVTVYVVVVVGLTVSVAVVPTTDVPSLHEYVNGPPPVALALSATGDPEHDVPGVAVALAATAATVTVTGADVNEHPVAGLVAVTVYGVVVVGLTLTVAPLSAPGFHCHV